MFKIPPAAEPLTQAIGQARVFTRPTFERFTALMIGLIVVMGRRTVSHALVVMQPLLEGHWSNYHRLYSWAKFSLWSLAAVLVRQGVGLLPADAVIQLVADDTVDGKEGDHVWGKSAHRDSVRSSHSKTVTKFGHKWLAMKVIGRLRGDANLYATPTHPQHKSCTGALCKKGCKLPSPQERITQLGGVVQEVAWYGSSRRKVRHISEQALWYDKHGNAVTPIRWVCVLACPEQRRRGNPQENLRNAFFFCSDPTMTAVEIIEGYARRWNIEVTFEESRALLGLETTRHWCRQSVLRVTPILLGLFTAVVLLWRELPKARQQVLATQTPCYLKASLTFADVLAAVRRELWEQSLLRHRRKTGCLSSLPPRMRQTILWHLSAAA